MQHQAPPRIRAFAQALRRNMTDRERRLWAGLRSEQLGFKFRRQHPLGCYIADFACLAPKLIVELDGSQHQAAGAYDEQRSAFFCDQGFDLLRFPSNAPLVDLEAVLQTILNRVNLLATSSPHPCLPPEGEGAIPIPTGVSP
ncbi:DUF559 domain-containing protein [Rhodoferax sp.]|uniref:endonuclease domain-containing protein n=1 Tax=Rhodoferax sp. TaxID=50421 RepID=UPI002609F1AD|nr:DUF559 domain-containing protein [Rhodoferax sp.]MDD5480775.1 DUF559 domain-containing protein [Rhodoferax sp.]